jgi:hypothetical protein
MRVVLLAAMVLAASLAGCGGRVTYSEEAISWPEAFLTRNPVRGLAIEVDAVEGYAPSAATLEAFARTIEEVVHKDEVVLLPVQTIPAQGGGYTSERLGELHAEYQDTGDGSIQGDGQRVVLHVLVLDGAPDLDAAGLSQGRGRITIFPDVWLGFGGVVFDDAVELQVLRHEAGHEFGLVNNGIPMVTAREDPDSPHHSTNPDSVMVPETSLISINLQSGGTRTPLEPRTFAEDDLADLRGFQAAVGSQP